MRLTDLYVLTPRELRFLRDLKASLEKPENREALDLLGDDLGDEWGSLTARLEEIVP